MNTLSPAFLLASLAAFFLGGITLNLYHARKEHYCWFVFCVSVGLWSLGLGILSMVSILGIANAFYVVHYLGAIFIPVGFLAFIRVYFLQEKIFAHDFIATLSSALFLYFAMGMGWLLGPLKPKWYFTFYTSPGFLYPVFVVYFFIVVIYCFFLMFLAISRRKREESRGLWFFVLATGFGYAGGSSAFLLVYDVPFPPYGIYLFLLFPLITSYAILRHHLLDIKKAILNSIIFTFIYSIVIGLPALSYLYQADLFKGFSEQYWYIGPLIEFLLLSLIAPYVFKYFKEKVEHQLVKEENAFHNVLVKASEGMSLIKDIDRLLKLTVRVVSRTAGVNPVAIYLLNEKNKESSYACYYSCGADGSWPEINQSMGIFSYFQERKQPLVRSVLEGERPFSSGSVNAHLHNFLHATDTHLIMPFHIRNKTIGLLCLGAKRSGQAYSKDDLIVFSILANQATLAIEDCNRWEAETKRMQEEGLRERTMSLEYMASSIAHEIDNPMHIIRQSLGFKKEFLLKDPRVSMPEEVREDFEDAISRSLNAAERVSGMIKAILDYSRMGTGKLEPIRIEDAVKGFEELMLPQMKTEKAHFTKEVEANLPLVMGERVQMGEILVNFVQNSLHAIRRNEEKFITLKIFRNNEDTIRFECSDNGYGIPPEIIGSIFLPSTTTKGSSEGTGLGLFRVRKIVDLFNGKVWAESEGKGKGATFIVELPVYKNNLDNIYENNQGK